MAVQRAVVKGLLGEAVQTRSMFTATVVVIPGDEVEDYWGAYLDSIYANVVLFTGDWWSAYEVEVSSFSGGSWVPFDSFAVTYAGGVSGDVLPNASAAVLLGKASGLRHVGRKFLSAISEAKSDGNTLLAGAMVDAAAALLAYVTPLTTILGTELTPGILDKAGTFHPFVSGVVSSILGSMRRRKPGVGI